MLAKKGRKNSEKNLVQLAQQAISKKTRRICCPQLMLQNLKIFDHLAQHFDLPLTKQMMKALMDLIEHGCPKNKKATTRLRVE
jgi:hypothetical protein